MNVQPVDFAVITVREDEYLALLDCLKQRGAPAVFFQHHPKGTYARTTLVSHDGHEYTIALTRCVEQGPEEAQAVTNDMIEDLDPAWILLVGIGGAVPDADVGLGDVVVATRLHDFVVGAVVQGGDQQFANQGGPMHPRVRRLLQQLPAMGEVTQGWQDSNLLGVRPLIPSNSPVTYGDDDWRARVSASLREHVSRSQPIAVSRPVASSGMLVKDTELLATWRIGARDVSAVEMELAGVYRAATRNESAIPLLAIRGISDIVGLKRESAWTSYACRTAASFAVHLLTQCSSTFFTRPPTNPL